MVTMKTLLRRAGLGLATGLLALGLFAGAGGASAAPLPAPHNVAAATSAASYYDPTIVIPRYVASGDPIAITGYGFDAYDAVTISLIGPDDEVVSSGTAYTVVAVDSYGTYIPVGLWITYD
jgi:hypothetical protein